MAVSFQEGAVISNISAKELSEIISKKNKIQLLDVRTAQEYKSGHISNATNIDVYKFEESETALNKLKKDEPIYVYCRSGQRSSYAAKYLQKMGFRKVYNLKGGYLDWLRNK